jgi:hypothetical protein
MLYAIGCKKINVTLDNTKDLHRRDEINIHIRGK